MSGGVDHDLSNFGKDPQALMRIPIGAASPLWGLFAGAAMTGAAWWWMTRWTRTANLEALFGAAEQAATTGLAEAEALAAPLAEAIEAAPAQFEAAIEAASESAVAVIDELTPTLPAIEALIDEAPFAVGGESAPISPVLEALANDSETEAAPAVKPKKAGPPKAD